MTDRVELTDARCGYTVTDIDGNKEPCDLPATGHRWYQDVGEHEDLLDVACDHHRNEGGRLISSLRAELAAANARVASLEHLLEGTGNRARREAADLRARVAELEADRAEYEPRLRELTASLIEARAETAAFRKSNEDWRETSGEAVAEQEAAQREARSWESNYNTLKAENAQLRSRITEGLVCPTCKTDFAENAALQATLDRVNALADEWDRTQIIGNNTYADELRAALTPEGTE